MWTSLNRAKQIPDAPWDCHICRSIGVVDWGVNGAAYMAVPWSVWELEEFPNDSHRCQQHDRYTHPFLFSGPSINQAPSMCALNVSIVVQGNLGLLLEGAQELSITAPNGRQMDGTRTAPGWHQDFGVLGSFAAAPGTGGSPAHAPGLPCKL